jgi:hypothetical protein
VAEDPGAIAERLFAGVMAPLVLGGAIRPGHAIGAKAALALGEGRVPADTDLAARTSEGRVRRARRLVPIDALPGPSAAEWTLAAAFHDVIQSANPSFDAALRRGAAVRVLALALAAIERVSPPETVSEALSRHTWFARIPEVARTDSEVRWWSGRREYLGVEPPELVQAWPRLRKVSVVRVPRPLLELAPIAVDRERLSAAVAELLVRTPLTDLATCTRPAPLFEWHPSTLALAASDAGRTISLRALARCEASEVDGALGRATRALLAGPHREQSTPAVSLLADRAISDAQQRMQAECARPSAAEPTFALALGALAARCALVAGEGAWSPVDRARLIEALTPPARSAAAREAHHLFKGERDAASSTNR